MTALETRTRPAPRAFVGGVVVDVRSGTTHRDWTIVIADGRFARVGPRATASVPPDADVVDARGTWLIPGLIDMHAHVSRRPDLLPVYVAHGVTAVRDPGGALTPLRLLREALERGARIGPRVFFAGPLLDGIPPLWPEMTLLVDTDARAESSVRFLATQGVDFIKVYNSVPERSLEIIVRSAHELGLRVTGHVPRAITMTRAIELGMDGLEHIRITGREILPRAIADQIDFLPVRRREALLWERYDPSTPPFARLAELLAAKRVFIDPTFAVDASPLRTNDERRAAAEETSGLPEWVGRIASDPAYVQDFMRVPAELLEISRAGFEKRQRFIALCARAGVRIVAGTDVQGPGDDLPGRALQRELQYLVEAGLPPLQALQAGTITAAEALGRERELGSLEGGKLADMLILEANPLEDIRNVRKIRTVVHRGEPATPEELTQPR